ncbi:MAG: 2-C-methyl-D-erythritol 4-phosphate cytidylyltransferase [Desulfuromonadales bacterium]|nr:2-C-methyl-D-erythritol 4-phosphate cytidylyltransferase [Desulfuromonadales bacterium]
MKKKTIALIPAAGMGKRMGASINKQYLSLGGMPIVARTIKLFQEADFIDEIYPIVPLAEIEYCQKEVIDKFVFTKVRSIVAGGPERQHSVRNGLRAIDGSNSEDIVIIHDGVRPLVPLNVVKESVKTASVYDGAVVAVPVKDTVKVVDDGQITETPPRGRLWLAQTPQTFRYKIIRDAHEAADVEGFLGTDDASLLERLGKKVGIVLGDYRNIKITTPEDIVLAEAFLKS